MALLVVSLAVAACGSGPGVIERFEGGEVVEIHASADIEITAVSVVPLASVRPVPSSITAPRGGGAVFTAVAEDSEGRLLTGVRFEWSMREPLAGTITSNGVFTAGIVPGSYPTAIEIVALQESDGREVSVLAIVPVVVNSGFIDVSVASVAVFPSTATARPGEVLPLRAAALGSLGRFVQDVDLFWRVLDPDLGVIDRNGLLTVGSKPGFYESAVEVQARRLAGAAPPVTARASVRVLTPEEASGAVRAVVGPSYVSGRPLERVALALLTFDFQGRPVPLDGVDWEVLQSGVGTVDADGRLELGLVAGSYPGSVHATGILGGAYEGRTVEAFLDVIIQPPLGAVVVGTPGEGQIVPSTLRVVAGQQGTVVVFYTTLDGTVVTSDASEFVYDPAILEVDSRGRVTALGAPGVYPDAIQTTIPGPAGATLSVAASVVIVGPMVRVEVRPARAQVAPDGFEQFSALAFDAVDNQLFDVAFRWELDGDTPGSMTFAGFYQAGDKLGVYTDAVRLRAVQRQPR